MTKKKSTKSEKIERKVVKSKFFFPRYNQVIEAESLEKAELLLKK